MSILLNESLGRSRLTKRTRRLLQRLLGGIIVLWASATVTFFALKLTPGDPVRALLGGPSANPTPETIAATIREFGLDKPVAEQYLIWLKRLLSGDFGVSFSQHQPVAEVIAEQIGPTLQLTLAALLFAWLLALVSVLATVCCPPAVPRLKP